MGDIALFGNFLKQDLELSFVREKENFSSTQKIIVRKECDIFHPHLYNLSRVIPAESET